MSENRTIEQRTCEHDSHRSYCKDCERDDYIDELQQYIGKLQNLLHERGCNQWCIDRSIGKQP